MRKRLAIVLWATAHLVAVAAIAAHFYPVPRGTLLPFVNFYYGFTGANAHYGFFAPNIGTQIRASFQVIGKDGEPYRETLGQNPSHEAQLRLNNLVALFSGVVENSKLERTLTASWASRIFFRHPDAKAVIVQVEALVLPSMQQYRNGARPHWETIYVARYTHA